MLGSILKDTLKGAGKGFVTEGATEAGQETISVLNRADMDPTFTREEGMLRIGQAAFMGGITGKVVGGAGGATSGSAKAMNSIFGKAQEKLQESREQRVEEALDEESSPSPQQESPQGEFVGPQPRQGDLFDPENAPYEPTLQERIEIDYAKQALAKQRSEEKALQERAKTEKRRKQAKKNFTPKDEDGLLAAIAARGGLDRADYDIAGNDYGDYFKTRVGSKFVFTKKGGLSLDDMGEALWEAGFYNERPDFRQLQEDLDNALRSDEPYFTAAMGPSQESMEAMREEFMDTYYGPESDDVVRRDMETGDTRQRQAQFREKMATALENVASKNPNNQRLRAIADRYITGNAAVRDGILQTMFAPQRDEQYIDTSTTDGATEEQLQEFFAANEGQEATEEVLVTENKVKKDPNAEYKNTKASREAYEEAFGETDWASPIYAYMTEAFLNKAAAAKQQYGNVDLQVDRDLLGKPEAYRLTRTDFKRDEQAPNKEFVEQELKLATGSNYADGSGAEITLPDGTVQPVNLVNLTNSGRRLLNMRGDATFQGGAQIGMAQKGLPEFLSELKQVDERYDVRVNGVSLYGLDNKQSVKSQIGKKGALTQTVTGARAYGEDIAVEDVLQPQQPATGNRNYVIIRNSDEQVYMQGKKPFEYFAYDNIADANRVEANLEKIGIDAKAYHQKPGTPYVVTGSIRTKPPVKSDEPSLVSDPQMTLGLQAMPLRPERTTPKSGPSSSPEESMMRRQAVEAMNEESRLSSIEMAKGIYSYVREFEEVFFSPEAADAYANKLRARGADNVTVTEVGQSREASPDDPRELATGREDGLQQGDYNIDPDTGRRLNDGVPMSRLNLESNPRMEMDRRPAVPNRRRPRTGVGPKVGSQVAVYPTGSLNDTVQQVITRAMRVIRPSKPVAIMGVAEVLKKTDAELQQSFENPRVVADIKAQAQRMQSRSTSLGHYMGFQNAHMILVDNTKGNELQQALVVAHELGHVLFQEEKNNLVENRTMRKYMWDAFNKARTAKDAPEQYRGEENLAFEEWFADQVAIWAKQDLAKKEARSRPRGLVQAAFKRIAGRLETMWKAIRGELRKRFGANEFTPHFNDYMDNVVTIHRKNSKREGTVSSIPFHTKKLVRDMEAAFSDSQKEKAEKVTNAFQKILYGDKSREFTKWILAEDNMLRAISPKIANMFYVQAQSEGKGSSLGFINAKNDKRNELLNDLEDILGSDWDTPEAKKALDEASGDAATSELEGKSRQLRDWFTSLHENYISQTPGNQIGFRENYFPVALDLSSIYENPEEFIQTIIRYNPEKSESLIRRTVDGLVAQRAHILEDGEIEFDASNPLKVVEEAREFTDNVPPSELRRFTESPEVALIRYVRHQVIRNEFLRHTRTINGDDLLEAELNKLSPADRAKAVQTIERYLGYTKTPLNPTLQKVNSWFQLFNWVTLLPLATVSSITEMGGAIVNTKEFGGFEMALKGITSNIKNRDQAIELSRQLGVTVSTAMGNLGLTDADDEFLDPRVRKLSDKFFKVIGLDWYTRFTREFASVVGVEFIKTHAANKDNNPRAQRYLEQLGLNAETVAAWEKSQVEGQHFSFEGPEGEAVKAGLRRFVENSMLRPNAAERTFWGNDPRFTLVWALKSYLYSFGKVIMGGVAREMRTRYGEADTKFEKISAVGMSGLLAAAAFMPLAMLALELRELAKAGIAGILPGVEPDARYFRSDRMDYGTYLAEIFDRAGFQGPLSLFANALNAEKYGGTGIGILGPTAGLIVDDIGMGLYRGEGWEIVPSRILPGYSLVR